jgi:acyl-CoA hydrolase
MPAPVTPDEAVARLRAADTVGLSMALGQPTAFIQALGRRDDWTDLRLYGACTWPPRRPSGIRLST